MLEAKGGFLNEVDARRILIQVVRGVAAMHERDIMHRDLKLDNIMVHFPSLSYNRLFDRTFKLFEYITEFNLDEDFQVKLADLGLARKVDADEMSETFCGTPLYMAPEVARGDPYEHQADIWSVGCIFYQLLVGWLPFTANNAFQLVKVLEEGTYFLPKFVEVSEDCIRILTRCLQYDVKERLNWRDLIEDPYITNEMYKCYDCSETSRKEHKVILEDEEKSYHKWMLKNPEQVNRINTHEQLEFNSKNTVESN